MYIGKPLSEGGGMNEWVSRWMGERMGEWMFCPGTCGWGAFP